MIFSLRRLSLILSFIAFNFIATAYAVKVDFDKNGLSQATVHKLSKRNVDDLYMVILNDEPLARYQGGKSGLIATSLQVNKKNVLPKRSKLNVKSTSSKKYLSHLKQRREALIERLSSEMVKKVKAENTYMYSMNAFTARFTKKEMASLYKQKNIKKVLKI